MLRVELELVKDPAIKACKEVLSDFITAKFGAELELGRQYVIKPCTGPDGTAVSALEGFT